MTRIVAFAYGFACYGMFLAVFTYLIAFTPTLHKSAGINRLRLAP